MNKTLLATILLSGMAVAQQPCPTGYHHEGDSTACWPDVSRHQESNASVPQTMQPTSQPQPTQPTTTTTQSMPPAQTQTKPTQPVKSASLVIFREKSKWVRNEAEVHIFIDNVEVAKIEGGSYFSTPIEPGKHTLSASGPMLGDRIAKPKFATLIEITQVTKYVRMEVEFRLYRTPSCHFVPTTTDDGKTAVAKLHILD